MGLRGGEPGDQEGARAPGPCGQPPDPRLLQVRSNSATSPRARRRKCAPGSCATSWARSYQGRRAPISTRRSSSDDAPDPEAERQGERRTERGRRGNEGVERAAQRLPDRDGNGRRSEHDEGAAPRAAQVLPRPERRRKHVPALRAQIAAERGGTTRDGVERGATHDRNGRTIAVERISTSGEEARLRRAGEKRSPRTGRPKAGKRGGRVFEAGARLGRSDSFETRRARDGEGRERPPHSRHSESGRRPDLKSRGPSAERRESGPRERRFDRHEGKRDGQHQNRGPRTRDAAAPARGREFERPHVQKRDRVGKGRPPGAGAKDRGPRSEFKPSGPHADARDGARRARSFDRPADQRSGDQRSGERKFERPHGQRRDTKSEDGPRRVGPGKGSPKGANGPRPPPRKP